MKGVKLKYNGPLIWGKNSDSSDTPSRWHIRDNPVGAGDFIACGIAEEELVQNTEDLGDYIDCKNDGFCTCEECIEQITRWREITDRCPRFKNKRKKENEQRAE